MIATASGVPEEILPAYQTAFEQLGASAVRPLDIRTREQAGDPENVALVKRSDVVFFTGGD